MTAAIASATHTGTALWYLTRATGLVSLVLLSGTVVLGIVSSVGWTAQQWPRFVSQAMHRNLSLFSLALIGVHVVTTVADGYVPIGYRDALLPFLTPYRPIWVGLGAVAFDILLAVGITSGLRRHIGVRAWRGVHYLAYLCWPTAVMHGLGSGTDARLSLVLLIELICIGSVVGSVLWRLVEARGMPSGRRLAAAATTAALVVGIGTFALAGPLQPGWSRRAGTSPALLAQLSARFSSKIAGTPSGASASVTAPTTVVPTSASGLPPLPFNENVTGTIATSSPNSAGDVEVQLTMQVRGASSPLQVQLIGRAVNGGVAMSTSTVKFGNEQGAVTALDGSSIAATLNGPIGTVNLVLQLSIDQSSGTFTGSVSGSSGANR
jgi:sulfoxide reductase heme-binding subunit YedZ